MSGADHPRRRRRRLTADDRAVWDVVARGAVPLRPETAPPPTAAPLPAAPLPVPGPVPAPPLARPPAVPVVAPRVLRPAPPASGVARITLDLADQAPARVGRPEAGLDRRTAERLREGERVPDARLDLHGLTAEVAHRALDRFIAEAVARQWRCVLVITGKGGRKGGVPDDAPFMRPDQGVLRQAAPRWLRSGAHARDLVGIYEAHQRHGGAGAFYVYLKRRR